MAADLERLLNHREVISVSRFKKLRVFFVVVIFQGEIQFKLERTEFKSSSFFLPNPTSRFGCVSLARSVYATIQINI